MINPKKELFRWGPIPGRLISVSHWIAIYYGHPKRLHAYFWPPSYLILRKSKMLFINGKKELENVGGKVFREIILTSKIKKFLKFWKFCLKDLFLFCRPLSSDYFRSVSDSTLKELWHKFNDLVLFFWEIGIISEFANYGGAPILDNILDREDLSGAEKMQALSVLSAPVGFSFYQEEEIDLLKLMQKYKTAAFEQLLEAHQKKYFWLENSYFYTKVLKTDFFLNKIKELIWHRINPNKVIQKMHNHLAKVKSDKLKVLSRLKNKTEIRKISEALSFCIWWQDQRKKYIFHYLHYLDLFLREFERRAKIPAKIYDFAWPEEVSVNPSKEMVRMLRKRISDYFVVYFSRNVKKNFYGNAAKKIYDTFWFAKETREKEEVKGTVVFSNNKLISGEVFIIKKVTDIKKFPRGKILVTSMTAPEYISAMRKAKAIVTDEGGLTCHAAIVSRELRIPCVVGTKIATKVLKDGDWVEVDVERGIVKKL